MFGFGKKEINKYKADNITLISRIVILQDKLSESDKNIFELTSRIQELTNKLEYKDRQIVKLKLRIKNLKSV